MKHFTASLVIASLFLVSARAEEANVPAFFVLSDRGEGTFDMEAWQRATKALKNEDFVRTYRLGADGTVLQKAQEDAAKVNAADNIVMLMTTTTQDKNSTEFHESLRQVEQQFQTDPTLKGASVLARWPMCALVQLGKTRNAKMPPIAMIFVLDHPQANAFCYPMVQSYFTTPLGPDGKRVAPISIDGATVALQAVLPPMKLTKKTLADKAAFKQGNLVERPNNVYAPGEEIFIYAFFENVGRKDVGTPMSSYEIGLDIEVRDQSGKVLKSLPDEHTYKADSPPPFPVSLDYFSNFATAGISLDTPGSYTIVYIFHDRSRPETLPAAAEFDVTVK
ncbi:hypothetical protein G6N74_28785 [Mesorhizobium sp. CGMCC 1.15528]|uniref:VWA domain-containing protein n=1 Tax=Mesorhizobium zhangyense TaxID=1776730 RepID=A0A7C9RC90_9HYPH|nr:hypothetical protein [Mesorhizobium zhangyense]NGN45057.1 hypothetical protein [Mesorhizobium zhangyense]